MDVILDTDELRDQMARDVRSGLAATPKALRPTYFYDAHGSDLFDRITRLPEYYPTRREREILQARAGAVAEATGAETLIELGSGTSEKTRLLLRALTAAGTLRRFVPFDVDPAVLRTARSSIEAEFPGLEIRPIAGDFEQHLDLLPSGSRRLLAFLGSTIGNLDPAQRADFFDAVRSVLGPGDALLLGTDLVKAPERLVAAYDDPAGVTAAFNKNVLAVINRELGGDFDPAGFDHVAVWDAEREWMEMRLRSRQAQTVRIAALDLEVSFDRGEEMRTEISAKFTRGRVETELAAAGLRLEHWWTDAAGDFGLSLSVPSRSRPTAN
jgi:L-histidine N-alpha-methyltransferase